MTRCRIPHFSANSSASAKSLRFRLLEPDVTASASAPKVCAATWATSELSTPPEKATMTFFRALMFALSFSYFWSSVSFIGNQRWPAAFSPQRGASLAQYTQQPQVR